MNDKDPALVSRAANVFAAAVAVLDRLHALVEDSGQQRAAFMSCEAAAATHQALETINVSFDQATSPAELLALLDKATLMAAQVRDQMVDGLVSTVTIPDHPPVD